MILSVYVNVPDQKYSLRFEKCHLMKMNWTNSISTVLTHSDNTMSLETTCSVKKVEVVVLTVLIGNLPELTKVFVIWY